MYRITRDARYAERARDEMLALAAMYNWNPSHFLDTAAVTGAMAIGYDWTFETLKDEDRATIRNAIVSARVIWIGRPEGRAQ